MQETNNVAAILKAIHFAAGKHRIQRRKDVEKSPYINHLIEVAELLSRVGGVTDLVTLQAAILHDTVEDTKTSFEELEREFGAKVREVVESVTDDKKLPKEERKRLQIEHAPHIPERAKLVKISDKISNVLGVAQTPPADWSLERRQEYLDWTEKVVNGCRGCNPNLENHYDQVLQAGRQKLEFLNEDTPFETEMFSTESRLRKLTPEEQAQRIGTADQLMEGIAQGIEEENRKHNS
jgi:guanosine-3',5'-bis(diphosphate) 3'-pyrophosphohydrolase